MKGLGNKAIMSRNLRRLMREKDVTPKEMSAKLDIPYTTLLSWMKADNYPRIDKIEAMADFFGVMKSDLIEDKVIDEKKKKVDVAVEIVKRLGADQQFCDAVKMLYKLDSKQLSSVTQMLSSFFRDGSE